MKNKETGPLSLALGYLARRRRTAAEVRDLLRRSGFKQSEIEETLSYLENMRYVDDVDYARAFIEDRETRAPCGRARLYYLLAEKGIDRALVDRVLSELEYEELGAALRAARNRPEWQSASERQRQRLYRFLLGRGFSHSVIMKVINSKEDDQQD
ncbi:MAG: regulatory protein RecX [Bacillota bacterium]